MTSFRLAVCALLVLFGETAAYAQQVPYNIACNSQQQLEQHHWLCTRNVVLKRDNTSLFADQVEFFENDDRVVATGNVLFVQGRNQISADRADFNTKTKLGTFWGAWGMANIQPQRQMNLASGGFVAPQMTNQDTDVIFFGDIVEKLGPKKYRITRGAFTTCLQPEPRWEFHADRVTLNVDDYALLRQAIFNVKGVPVLYVPAFYYPINKDGRATGFLIPSYSATSLRGSSIRNEFFWAIGRSHDATLTYDWYAKTGQGYGAEYRYNIGSGSGVVSNYTLQDNQTTYSTGTLQESRSYFLRGYATQQLPYRLQMRANLDYFSSFSSNQLLSTNISTYSQNNRTYGVNVVGGWRRYSFNGTFDRSEYFGNATNSTLQGRSPQLALSGSDQQLFETVPIYGSFSGEFAQIDRRTISNDVVIDDRSLIRTDVSPRVRYPFKQFQWLTVNSSLAWRDTFYTRSIDPETNAVLEDNLNRQVVTLQADMVGPVFNRVWDTPNNGYAEKFKHSIEPFLTLTRQQSLASNGEAVAIDATDLIFTDTSYRYGLRNHFYAKQRTLGFSQAREIVTAEISQTYHNNVRAAQVDPNYTSSTTNGTAESHFTPVLLALRVAPVANFFAGLKADYDVRHRELRTLTATSTHNWVRGSTSVSWSQRFRIAGLDDFAIPSRALSVSTNAHTRDNRYGANYSFTYDGVSDVMLQQTYSGYYNAQCCGFALQYTNPRYPSGAPIEVDHRLFVSVTLAGLGSFSPFSPGLGGIGR